MRHLVTGVAGFIGYHTAERLLAQGEQVVGIDNLNDYYDPQLKLARLELIKAHKAFQFQKVDVANRTEMEALFKNERFGNVIHLAAQAGVRYSLDHPHEYAESNLVGFLHVLEGVRHSGVQHFIYASSSSVYGGNKKVPFSVADRVDSPVSLYAATKRANELMAHSYTHLFGVPTTGLRFFTVYGPWGRPDMAPFKFAHAIANGGCIDVYNYGRMQRDFTYVDDIVAGITRIAEVPADGYRLFNVGNSAPVGLMEFIHTLEEAMGRKVRKRFLPIQPGDVVATHADVDDFWKATGFRPQTSLRTGIERFADWFKNYYGHKGDSHEYSAQSGHYSGNKGRAATVLRAF
jgi:UDP-glucuronate 4-epimerase